MTLLSDKYEFYVRLEKRLKRIVNILVINASFIDNQGLLSGKMGIAIFFYYYYRHTENKIYEEFAGQLIDEIYEDINTSTPVNFENGLTGVGWGIEYLVKNKFVEADTDEALEELDNIIYRKRLQSRILINGENDIFGYGLYYIARITGHLIDDDDINTLIKKYHLIFLIDECERILLHKDYLNHNIKSLNLDSLNSFLWFLLEVSRLNIFPAKVDKILNLTRINLPELINDGAEPAGLFLFQNLLREARKFNSDILSDVIPITKNNFKNPDAFALLIRNEAGIDSLLKNTWQQLIYRSYIPDPQLMVPEYSRLISILDNEEIWNERLKKTSGETLGLSGMAGLGLTLLDEILKYEHLTQNNS